MFLEGRPHADFHILPKGREKVHKTLDGESAGPIAHQRRNVGLLDAEDLPSFDLSQIAILDEEVDLKREPCLQEFLLGMGKTQIREHVPTALFYLDAFF